VLTIVVLWVPALLRQNGMAASDTAIVVAFHGLGAFIGMAIAGRLLERFGAAMALAPAFLIGAVFTAALGSVGTSVVLASVFDGLVGLFVGIGACGMIALSSLVYPTAIRSTGIGWAMGMGRLGQVFSPLATGAMLQAGWTIDRMFLIIAIAPVLAAIVVPLIKLARGASPATEANGVAQEALG
jgi:AAHS family 4-hydroxybenzoate transporter-like MFS transporter